MVDFIDTMMMDSEREVHVSYLDNKSTGLGETLSSQENCILVEVELLERRSEGLVTSPLDRQ